MNGEMNLPAHLVNVHQDLFDQRTKNSFLDTLIAPFAFPNRLKISSQFLQLVPILGGDFWMRAFVLSNAIFQFRNRLQRRIPTSLKFIGNKAILRVSRIVLPVGAKPDIVPLEDPAAMR